MPKFHKQSLAPNLLSSITLQRWRISRVLGDRSWQEFPWNFGVAAATGRLEEFATVKALRDFYGCVTAYQIH